MPLPNTDLSPLLQGTADTVHNSVREALKRFNVPDRYAIPTAAAAGAVVLVVGALVGALLVIVVKLATPLAQAVLEVIARARVDLQPSLNSLIGSALSEMLGVEISGADLPGPTPTGEVTARVQGIGNKLYAQFIKEFAPNGTVTPESGEAAAKTFAGFGINFAVVNSFISIIGELVSDDHLEQWRELGVEIAENLGLGRLQRRALGVLLQNVIEKPYAQQLQARYRPDKLSELQYVHAFQNGDISETELRKQLAYKGYADDLISIVITQLSGRSSPGELEELLYWMGSRTALPGNGGFNQAVGIGDIKPITQAEAIAAIRAQGFDDETAKRKLAAVGLNRAQAVAANYAAHVERLAVQGFMDVETARGLMQDLPFSPQELALRMRVIGLQLEFPHKTLTLLEMEQAYIDGIITVSEWDAWVQRQGYSPQDQQTLTFLLQFKLDAATHKGKTHVAALTFAEITAAYVDGFIDLAHAESWMQQKGYSPADQATLRKLLQAKATKAAAAPGAFTPPSA